MRRDGELIRSAKQVVPSEPIVTRLADGAFHSVVAGHARQGADRPARKNRVESARQGQPAQMDLFRPAQ